MLSFEMFDIATCCFLWAQFSCNLNPRRSILQHSEPTRFLLLSWEGKKALLFRCRSSEVDSYCLKIDWYFRLLGTDRPFLGKDHPLLRRDHPLLEKDHPILGKCHPLLGVDHPLLGKCHPLIGADHSLLGKDHPLNFTGTDHSTLNFLSFQVVFPLKLQLICSFPYF